MSDRTVFPTLSALDRERLRQALRLAEGSIGLTEPNPRVGCVIGLEDGTLLGQGATQQAGGPHAEVMALRDAQSGGRDVAGATAWVTLEPCAHHGRTPPCCDALLQAGIGRVVLGAPDPFPSVNGAGVARLRAAGVAVQMADGDELQACREINIGFFSRVERGRPWVRMKVAVSLDGRTALPDGRSQWITGPAARRDVHAWRRRSSAVLTGVQTVLADDPQMNVRWVTTAMQPMRIVLDSRWRTPASAQLLSVPGRTVIVGLAPLPERAMRLRDAGAELWELPADGDRVDLSQLLPMLAERGVNELHVEAGPTINGALLAGGWVDEWLVYAAPKLLGEGLPMARLPDHWGAAALNAGGLWRFCEAILLDGDLRLRARQHPPTPSSLGEAGEE